MMSTYGALPQLDQLKTKPGQKDVTFTAAGYGLQSSFPDAAAWKVWQTVSTWLHTPNFCKSICLDMAAISHFCCQTTMPPAAPASVIQEAPTLLATQMLPVE